jgi:D-3-phosphoglycerate dehydrogenase
MKKVFLCEYIHPDAFQLLKKHVEVIHDWQRFPEADAVISRNIRLSSELLAKAESLKIIGIHGTGVDDVDMAAAKRQCIDVFSVPHQNSRSVAEMNVALMLALGRKIVRADRILSDGRASGQGSVVTKEVISELLGMELYGKKLGLIGVGDISRQTAEICRKGFGMEVFAWSRHMTPEIAEEMSMTLEASIEAVLSKADIVVIGVSLTEDTRGLIGREQLGYMKKDALLINTARGAVVDERALYERLVSGQIGGAAGDVFTDEPVCGDNPLLTLQNFVATPHLGANTEEALRRVGMAVVHGTLERLERL